MNYCIYMNHNSADGGYVCGRGKSAWRMNPNVLKFDCVDAAKQFIARMGWTNSTSVMPGLPTAYVAELP